jgi:diguanylate cyclase (GGDEF)-like protein
VGGLDAATPWLAGAIATATFLVLWLTQLLSVFDARLASTRLAASLRQANAELSHLSLHDVLTKLPNRVLLEDRIGGAIESCKRAGGMCAVLFVDLDCFKGVNDALGHAAGDEILRVVAQRLRSAVRTEDTVSRLGGDEFVVLLRHISHSGDAMLVARKILELLSVPASAHGKEVCVTPSIGISIYPAHGQCAESLITDADAAMYNVKKTGRNGIGVFEAGMSAALPVIAPPLQAARFLRCASLTCIAA